MAGGSATELFVALELSSKTWVVATHIRASDKMSQYRVNGGDVERLLSLIGHLRMRTAGASGTAFKIMCSTKPAATGSGSIAC
jgi:hypothetical protein